METLANIQQKLNGAEDLKSVVRTMKAMAASNISQYETAVRSLSEYSKTIGLGFLAYYIQNKSNEIESSTTKHNESDAIQCAIIFGSDQGLVGKFNDTLSDFARQHLNSLVGKKEIWAVGERVAVKLTDMGLPPSKTFLLPSAVEAITPLVREILLKSEQNIENKNFSEVLLFHNQPKIGVGYKAVVNQLLPLNQQWKKQFLNKDWPNLCIPEVAGNQQATLLALIHEFLFTSLFKACAESLASENASRLLAMQRAEKNIGELLDHLNQQYHQLRQGLIDEELFDVIAGFEALKKK